MPRTPRARARGPIGEVGRRVKTKRVFRFSKRGSATDRTARLRAVEAARRLEAGAVLPRSDGDGDRGV